MYGDEVVDENRGSQEVCVKYLFTSWVLGWGLMRSRRLVLQQCLFFGQLEGASKKTGMLRLADLEGLNEAILKRSWFEHW